MGHPITGPRSRKKPTQFDVARLADVSQATVSQVLNSQSKLTISTETKAKVVDAIAKLGYVPNRTAQSLRSQRTYTIACLIPDITNPFYPAVERGILDVCDKHGYDVLTFNSDGQRKKEDSFLRLLQEGRVDGAIGAFFHLNATHFAGLLEAGMPVVRLEAVAKRIGDLPLDNVFVDNIAAAEAATNYLLAKGNVRIAFIGREAGPQFARLQGYRQALRVQGMREILIGADDFTEEGGHDAMQKLLETFPRPDAVFAANDLLAVGALIAARQAGVEVPRDLSIMGFDDIPIAKLTSPSLTTVAQPQKLIGSRAAELLFERLLGSEQSSGRNEELPFELIIRDSA